MIAQRKARCKERRELGESSGLMLPFCSLLTSLIFFVALELALIVKLLSTEPTLAGFPSGAGGTDEAAKQHLLCFGGSGYQGHHISASRIQV